MNHPHHRCCLALLSMAAAGCIVFSGGPATAQVPLAAPSAAENGKDARNNLASSKHSHPVDLGTFWHTDERSDDEAENLVADTTVKLQSIILPEVDLRGVSLNEAIQSLREQIIEQDPEPDATKRGVNVFLKLPAGSLGTDTPLITMYLEKTPALVAFREAAQRSGMKVRVGLYAISIVPPSEQTERLYTADCSAPPEMAGSTTATRTDMKSWLEAKGVKFPPGSSAAYVPATRRLVVRQSRENLANIKFIISTKKEAEPSIPVP